MAARQAVRSAEQIFAEAQDGPKRIIDRRRPWMAARQAVPLQRSKFSRRPRMGRSESSIGIFGAVGFLPPVLRRLLPLGILVDAVDRAHRRQALAAARAQLR